MLATCPHNSTSLVRGCVKRRVVAMNSNDNRVQTGTAGTSSSLAPLVKICGVTSAEDSKFAASQGADLIGMIMWPKAKRSVDDHLASAIAGSAHAYGAASVGVFVDEDAPTIVKRCRAAGLRFAQLHGDGARESLFDLPEDLPVIYVMHASPDGVVQTATPSELATRLGKPPRKPDYILIDSLKGGSGMSFDWTALQVPEQEASTGWLLAGGLQPDTVGNAVGVAAPSGVDVSSGVCGPDGLAKDHEAVRAFVANAKSAVCQA